MSRFECPRCQASFDRDVAKDEAFVECPSCGSLALPSSDVHDLATQLTGSHSIAGLNAEDLPPPAVTSPNDDGGRSLFATLFDATRAEPAADAGDRTMEGSAPTPSAPVSDDATVKVELGGPNVIALEAQDPLGAAPESFGLDGDPELEAALGELADKAPAIHALPARFATEDSRKNRAPADSHSPPAFDQSARNEVIGAQSSGEEQRLEPTDAEKGTPWSALSEDAFANLEKAFDDIASRPNPAAPPRPPPRRSAPPLRARPDTGGTQPAAASPKPPQRRRSTHLALSDDAKALAFLPARQSAANPVDDQTAMLSPSDSGPAEGSGSRSGPGADEVTSTEAVRGRRTRRDPVPAIRDGFTMGRAAALIVAGVLLGGAVGWAATPVPTKAVTTRSRAELRVAEGNRFYLEGRFDDALGAYRNAARLDPTYALAHRAAGAALAKQQRWDDAAGEYSQYLMLEPEALDAVDVKENIARRGAPK